MNFKKLALATAIVAAPAAAFSMEEITDATMSDVTGQDGITVEIVTGGMSTDVYVHDKNGFSFNSYNSTTGFTTTTNVNGSYSFGGAIVIDNMSIGADNTSPITLDIDAGDSAAASTAPILNVKVSLPATLTIVTGSIHVANSARDSGASNASWGIGALSSTIMNSMSIVLGNAAMNIQLGNEAQQGLETGPDMIVLGGRINGGLTISNFALSDSNSTGAISASTILVTNTGETNLDLLVDINVVAGGLQIQTGQVGHVSNGLAVNMVDVRLGSATSAAIGDVSLVGLNLNNTTITVRGH